MKIMRSFGLTALFLLLSVSGQALLPPQYTEELFDVNTATQPSRIIVKYFEPIDKGFRVEIGNRINNVMVVDFKDNHRTACWEYDTKGNLKEKYELAYNEYGILASVSKKDKNQNVQLREEFVYSNPKNENTLKEKRIYNQSDLNLLGQELFLRDKQGRVSASRHLDGAGKEKYTDSYTYNSEGLVEREVRLDPSGSRRSETEKDYDEEGRMISEIVYDRNGKTVAQSKYSYNIKGLPDQITMTTTEVMAEYYTIEYTYDERGNWIQQVIYKGMGRVPEVVVVRTITY